jgi:hypothetical protein
MRFRPTRPRAPGSPVALRAPSDPGAEINSGAMLIHVPPRPSTVFSERELSHGCWHGGRLSICCVCSWPHG